ncbi:hypothetical protein [Kitasatospora sp. NPDC059673]|uniref:hypothetical protein n=1 Tax=Kitasatospora sp. NPDC059673 TaxID=3346901 RepID=UPI0036B7AA97
MLLAVGEQEFAGGGAVEQGEVDQGLERSVGGGQAGSEGAVGAPGVQAVAVEVEGAGAVRVGGDGEVEAGERAVVVQMQAAEPALDGALVVDQREAQWFTLCTARFASLPQPTVRTLPYDRSSSRAVATGVPAASYRVIIRWTKRGAAASGGYVAFRHRTART